MKILLSPAKNLNDQSTLTHESSIPIFEKEAYQLVKDLKKIKKVGLQELMDISLDLATQNVLRFKQWKKASLQPENAFPAVEVFDGEVYRALSVTTLESKNLARLNKDLRILSGLYGIVKPFDLIYPYRLEMGTKFSPKEGQKNLYDFWGDKVTKALKKELDKDEVIVNLASSEYFKVIRRELLKNRIITPVFKEFKNGQFTTVMMYAKHARGAMTRYLIEHPIADIEELKLYDVDGYQYNELQSTQDEWVFIR
ncbi:MAG: hypothetical protein RLZZ30_928 [Bacteroidota bacterium]|jgi:cytoplasmic iron level regulating protein YaaA (DUF328/UPF0246 family)